MNVKVGVFGAEVREFALAENATLGDALKAAGIEQDVVESHTIVVSNHGRDLPMDEVLVAGDVVMLTPNVEAGL